MYKPVRKIKNSGTKKNTGFFPSKKNERPVAFESLLERDYLYLLEFDCDVISYKEQPITISYYYSHNSYRYTPDFWVQRKNKTQLIEIKPKSKLQSILSDNFKSKKFMVAAQYCKSNNVSEFKIVTDEEIRQGNILNNIKYLFSYSRLDMPASIKLKIRNELIVSGPQPIFKLLSNVCDSSDYSKYYSFILSMVYNQEIFIDLQTPISTSSLIQIKYTRV